MLVILQELKTPGVFVGVVFVSCCFFVGPMMADSLQIDLDLQICRWCTSNHTRTDHDLDPLQHEPHEHHLLYLFVTWSEGSRANKLRSPEVAQIHQYC